MNTVFEYKGQQQTRLQKNKISKILKVLITATKQLQKKVILMSIWTVYYEKLHRYVVNWIKTLLGHMEAVLFNYPDLL